MAGKRRAGSTEKCPSSSVTSVVIKVEPEDVLDPELSDQDRFLALRNPQHSEEVLDFVKTEEMIFKTRSTNEQLESAENQLKFDGRGESEFILPVSVSPYKNSVRTSRQRRKCPGTGSTIRRRKAMHTCKVCSADFCTKRELVAHTKTHVETNHVPEPGTNTVKNLAECESEVAIHCKKCSSKFKSKLALDIHECVGAITRSSVRKDKGECCGRHFRNDAQNHEFQGESKESEPEISIPFPHRSSNRRILERVIFKKTFASTTPCKNWKTELRKDKVSDVTTHLNATSIPSPQRSRRSFPKLIQRKLQKSRGSSKSEAVKCLRRSKAKSRLDGMRRRRNPQKCTLCSDTFKRSEHREAHMKARHPDIKPSLPCDECSKEFYLPRSLALHKRTHLSEKIYGCCYCDQKFHSKLSLFGHEKSHSVDKLAYLCHLCTKEFPTRLQLEKHERQASHSSEKQFKCPHCPKEFQKKRSFRVHLSTHNDTEEVLPCKDCGRDCISEAALRIHERKHAQRFECDLCEKSFVSKFQLKDHANMHTGQKPYKCNHCDKSFSRKSDMMAHTASVHAVNKPFTCEHCDKGFTRREMLDVHRRTHTGEKPCVCEKCGESFHSKRGLVRHQNLYHGEGVPRIKGRHKGVKNFPCTSCNKKFVSLEAVRYHEERIHSSSQKPFPCPSCEKGFQRSYFLEVHMRIHTGEKPFVCNLGNCGKNFRSKEALAIHHKKSHSLGAGASGHNSEDEMVEGCL